MPPGIGYSRNEDVGVTEHYTDQQLETTGLLSYHASTTQSDDATSSISAEALPSNGDDKSAGPSISYMQLLTENQNFRYFWLSYVANHLGEWMSYLASISLIQEVALTSDDNDTGDRVNTLISILILFKLLPNVFVMPLGGVLADKYDRRKVQIGIDVMSSLCVMVYLVAVHYRSIPVLYFAVFLQETLSGMYIPSNSSIIPLLTSSDKELEKATTLSGLTWSLMAALGSTTGGIFVALFGIRGCFLIDSITYLISASFLMFGVKGIYVATEEDRKRERRRSSLISIKSGGGSTTGGIVEPHEVALHANDYDSDDGKEVQTGDQCKMFLDGLRFVFVDMPMVGAFVLLKGSAAAVYGATDILNVAFSARGSEEDAQATSLKLGALFGCVGVGCIIGSTLTDNLASLSNPRRIFQLCLVGYVLISLGCFLMGAPWTSQYFGFICLSSIVRSIGSSLIWIDSTLLLQKFSPTPLLGRVQSLDFCAALFGEATSALAGGLLMDNMGLSPENLSLILSVMALILFALWSPLALRKMPDGDRKAVEKRLGRDEMLLTLS